MSTVNNGPQIVKNSLAFVLDPPVSAGFIKTPKQISNCITWFDADDLSTITTESGGRNVRYWADKSTSNLVLTGGGLTLANEPLSVLGGLNGRNTMRFDGGDYIYGAFNTSYTEFTIFLVMRGDVSSVNYQYPFSINNNTNTTNAFYFDVNDPDGSSFAKTLWVYWNSGGSPYSILPLTSPNTTSDFLQGSPTLLTFSHTNAGSGTNVIYVNGRARTDQSNVGTQTITIGGAGFFLFMGARSTGISGPYYGDIGELIIYSRQLSATERSQVQNYLSNKWRIPLLQTTLTNRDLVFGKVATCQNNNIPVVDKSYRVNPANATGSPLQSNFYFNDPVSWMSSVITTTITLEAWVKPNSFTFAGNDNGLGTIMIANSNFYLSIDSNGKFNAYLQGSGGAFGSHQPSTTSITRHAWNHVVVTFDGAYIRWYLNGVLDKTSSTTFNVGTITLTNYLGIGSEGAVGYGRFLDGYVAGCKIYGKALSSTEILQNYEQSKSEFNSLPNIVTSGLQLYLDADVYSSYVGSGTTWTDLSGNGNNATLQNSPSFVSTEPKNFTFNGTNQYATISMSGLRVVNITEEVWVFLSSTSDQVFIGSQYGTSSNNSFAIWVQSGAFAFGVNTGGNFYYSTISTVSSGVWYHLTHTYNGTTQYFYVNGTLVSTYNSSASGNITYDVNNTLLALAADWNGSGYNVGATGYVNGKMPVVRIYNRALSAAEVLQNYNATKFRFGK